MKFSPLHASLLALALFAAAGPATAVVTSPDAPLLLAQAETDPASPEFDAIRKFLAATQDVSQLDDQKLQQRLKRAKKLRETEGLPEELDTQLQQTIAALEAEITRRQEAAQQAPAEQPPADQPAEQPQQQAEQPAPQPEAQQQVQEQAPEPQPQAEQPPAAEAQPEQQAQTDTQPQVQPEVQPEVQAPAPEAAPNDEIATFLASVRPASELSEEELRQQMERATELSQTKGIPANERRALRNVIREARTALRSQQDNGAASEAQQQQPETPAAEQPQAPAAEQPQAPAADSAAQQPAAEEPQQQAEQPPAPKPQTDQQLANPTNVDPALEAQAKAILDDKVDVRTLKREELRQRLNTMRDLLVTNQLSVDTREALRDKLATEREVLRTQVALDEGTAPPQGGTTNNTANTTVNNNTTVTNTENTLNNTTNNTTNNTNTTVNTANVQVVLNDRRPADQLDDEELVRRIDIYRSVVADDRYDQEDRLAWQQRMEDDRRFLRRRMIEERRQREARLRAGNFELSFSVEDRYDPRREVPDDAFAAEVDDSEIADVLTAPPRRKIQRRYTVEDIERSPETRAAVARIEIDTVHFGFGEGFLREEEIDKLDRIAQVLEKILAKHPDEVFLLEGHTDAVGSDQSNLVLSKQRAEAVKKALVTYYVIPAENLKTVGLGERYLKIPTDRPEAENRRVSLARITPLVGQRD